MRFSLVLLVLLAGCARTDGAPEAPAPVETRPVRDGATGAELPRLVMPERSDVERRVNADLDSLAASLACPDGTPFETRASVSYAAHEVLSVSVHASYFCGGAYPTAGANLSRTYDLTTGARVPFEALWRDVATDRATILGVVETSLFPAAVGGEGGEACAGVVSAEALAETPLDYALAADGLRVQPELPHVAAACAAEVTIPYASVAAFAAPGGVLERVASAR